MPGHQVQRLAAQQSRDDRDLALNGKALRTIPVDARRGTYASFGGALRRPFGRAPFITRQCNTPVEVQFTSAGCLNYRAAPRGVVVRRNLAQGGGLLRK